MLSAALMTGLLQCWLAEEKGHTSTVRWPCMCVMQAAAVLRIVRLANLPDALHRHETQTSGPVLHPLQSRTNMVLRCTASGHCPCTDCIMTSPEHLRTEMWAMHT